MRTRESIYTPLGYDVSYVKREKFRGWGTAPVQLEYCLAKKDGAEFFVWSDHDGLYPKIMDAQDRIPHMARFHQPAQHHILMEVAKGELIWHLDKAPDPSLIEKQLMDFVDGANSNGFFHQDVRPWNVLMDEHSQITIIDWGNSRVEKSNIDVEDARRFIQLLKGEINFQQAWGWQPHWYPAWCKHD